MGQISSNSNFVHLPPLPRYMDSKKEIEWMRFAWLTRLTYRDRKGSDAANVDASNDRYVPYVKRMGDKTFKVNDYCVRGFFMNSEIKVACTLFADNSIAVWTRWCLKSSFGITTSIHCR